MTKLDETLLVIKMLRAHRLEAQVDNLNMPHTADLHSEYEELLSELLEELHTELTALPPDVRSRIIKNYERIAYAIEDNTGTQS